MTDLPPTPPGLVVNLLKGDQADRRIGGAKIVEISLPLDINGMPANIDGALAVSFFMGSAHRSAGSGRA